ncbi:MAG: hypothetical protein PWP15_1001 [Methanothermococcus sp.]|uniref:type II toxin-antitoxin system HicA family toxin n=1 Tax=Methanothermococcus TaxID=155862 RepID=UPI000366D6C7|nr:MULTISPECIES: type II toxin-antitoxin system HicA family toxin [Methanothermococcus]MDK2790494.1 hypothetical protein [Methanothermococcus sp.]MDK2987635.1 hypothetical protein [Methanothermococcus sp.]
MVKLPRISGNKLIKVLTNTMGYEIVRQKGSHIRLSKNTENGIHNITIPNHEELAKGTLNSILSSVSKWNNISKDKLIEMIK